MSEAHQLLVKMNDAGASFDEIRAAVEPLLAPGCKLEKSVDSCVTDSGTSGYKSCGRITGCDDSSNNTDWSCGACKGS